MEQEWIGTYGYLGLFVALLGVPIPGETFLALAGYLIYKGQLHPALVLLAAVGGSALGITGAWAIGRYFGKPLVDRYGHRIGLTEEKLARARRWFEQVGRWSLTFGYFIPEMRDVTGFTAGVSGLRYRNFAPFAYLGGVLWPVCYILLGYWVGEGWSDASMRLRHAFELAAAAVAGVLALYGLRVLIRRRRRRKGHR